LFAVIRGEYFLSAAAAIIELCMPSTDATQEPLFADLSDPQREAVAHTEGPLLILAGPGSGKTRVITRRAAHLACTVTEPRHVLAITFTNKAAKEMRERIDALRVAPGITVGTFHALCAKLLRFYHERACIPRNFTIFDRDDRRKVLKEAIERSGLSADHLTPAGAEQELSRAKNAMQSVEKYAAHASDWRQRMIARVYENYEKLLREMGGLDFDDLLMRMAVLLSGDAELREQLEDRFRYVLIDEYQDTNAAQYKIARFLTQGRANVCATGDPDQSIYGWRGADINNILSFERDYPSAKVVRLEQNYRSTKRILAAADVLIAANKQRKIKKLWTEGEEGTRVRIIEAEDGEQEADAVAEDIRTMIREGVAPSEIAVFYRVNSLSRTIEESLIRQGVPYQIARGVEFYNRKEIKDVLAYLRVLVNPADEVSLERIINTPPRGIGTTTIERLTERATSTGRKLFDVLFDDAALATLGRSGQKVREFALLLRQLNAVLTQNPAKALDTVISQSGLRAMYAQQREIDDAPSANLDELINAASSFEQEQPGATLVDWLEHAALVSDVDAVRSEGGLVTLMTLHAAKGLEFACVYMTGLEDGLLPFRRGNGPFDNGAIEDEEEERRLCFVGMTRAKKHLTLSRARYRMNRGVTLRTTRSRFLDELPREGVEWPESEARPTRRPVALATPQGRLPDDIEQWTIGTLVRHPAHGLGQVVSIHRGASRTHVDVQFQTGGRKSWVLEFAELTRVDYDDVG
jgi:DNA helicase-2/ATP-dependent DNA helicase PcrA